MSWYKWAAGLILFDIFMIMIIIAFGQGGEDIGSYDYDNEIGSFNSSEDIDFDAFTILDTFTVRFFGFPWWFYLFFVVYQIAMITIVVGGLVRGI